MAVIDQDEFTRAVDSLKSALRKYTTYHKGILEEQEGIANGGTLDCIAAYLQRESDTLQIASEHLESLPSVEHLDQELIESTRDILTELLKYYDKDKYHQRELRDAYAAKTRLNASQCAQIKRYHTQIDNQTTKLRKLIGSYYETINDSEPSMVPDGSGARDADEYGTGDDAMADTNNSIETALEGVADAISRLQDGQGSTSSSGTNSYSSFGRMLDQRLLTVLGMPDLQSDGALAMNSDDLTTKLFEGLDRTIVSEAVGGVNTFRFNPLRARSALTEATGSGLGAQGVAAETVSALKPAIMNQLHRLEPENVYSVQDEAGDLIRAIELGIDRVAGEASSDLGAYEIWVTELFAQIYRDLLSLASLYGITTKEDFAPFETICSDSEQTLADILSIVPIDLAQQRILRDPDVGILTAEANDRAIAAIMMHLFTMYHVLVAGESLGPLLGRARAMNDAIGGAIASVRSALERAGVSLFDRTIVFSGERDNSISLSRLLSWIENETVTSRPTLLRSDLNSRDLERLRSARKTQREAVDKIVEIKFPTVNSNRYAAGRRDLTELQSHLCNLEAIYDALVQESRDGTDDQTNT